MRRRHFLVRSAQTAAAFGVLRTLGACRKPAPVASNPAEPQFLALRDKYATPHKTLTDPMKYVDESYYNEAMR